MRNISFKLSFLYTSFMRNFISGIFLFLLVGCATGAHFNTGPEYDQKILLMVDDSYTQFQATRSQYDVGDLQSFHSQHTFPIAVEGAFKELFGQVGMIKSEAGIELDYPDVPAIFEVRMLDLANDIYNEADSYRAQTVIGVAMKSPKGNIFWQKAFRGNGYVHVDPQFSDGLGPQDAVLDAVADALDQMQEAIANSPEVQNQLKYYRASDEARRQTELKI